MNGIGSSEDDGNRSVPWSRRRFLAAAGTGLAGLGISAGPVRDSAHAVRRPNVVLIVSDDQGYADIGCQGCKDIPTPHMDSIAANGVRFTDGYVSCPLCSPSRAGLMTGRYQQRFGHEHNPGPVGLSAPGVGLPLTEVTMADRFKAVGYATGMVGKWHLGPEPQFHPMRRGFDEYFGFVGGAYTYFPGREGARQRADGIVRGTEPVVETEYLTDAFGREAVAFIERHRTEPFFLYLAFNAVHSPLEASDKYLERFAHISDENRRIHAGMLSAMDDAVGAVLAKLREAGIEKDSLVFFISDNGGPTRQTTSRNDPLRGYKGQVYEGGIRVPFLVQWKGRIPAGKVYEHPVISLDILPTALAAAGADLPKDVKLDGVNLLPHLAGERISAPHETLFWRMGAQAAARVGRWKLIRLNTESFELYDLLTDIGEQQDLAKRKPEVLERVTASLTDWESYMIPAKWVRASSRRQTGRRNVQNPRRRGPAATRFKQLDKDGDGRLSPQELTRPELSKRMDQDGDGFVTQDEAVTYFRNR